MLFASAYWLVVLKACWRLTSQDVVFTKSTAKILRKKGFRIPATRIVDFPDNFERAVLAEGHESMGEKWTHYGYRGTYGSFGTNGLYRENPWANNPNKNYVVPFYFDQNHSIDDQTKKVSGSTSELFFE